MCPRKVSQNQNRGALAKALTYLAFSFPLEGAKYQLVDLRQTPLSDNGRGEVQTVAIHFLGRTLKCLAGGYIREHTRGTAM